MVKKIDKIALDVFVSGESTQGPCEGSLKGRTFCQDTQYRSAYLRLSAEALTQLYAYLLQIVPYGRGDITRVYVEDPITFPHW